MVSVRKKEKFRVNGRKMKIKIKFLSCRLVLSRSMFMNLFIIGKEFFQLCPVPNHLFELVNEEARRIMTMKIDHKVTFGTSESHHS